MENVPDSDLRCSQIVLVKFKMLEKITGIDN